MKKILLIAVLVATSYCGFAQKLLTKNGEITFDATVAGSVDEVKATNKTVSSILDKSTGDFVVQALIKSFKFKVALMEEHFNENYMESDKLPKTTFKGKIISYSGKPGTYDVEGDLTIHGVAKKVKTKVTVAGEGNAVTVTGSFNVKLADYKLEVPALAKKTLAENAKISFKLSLEGK